MSEGDEVVGKASPHTIKKFELIEKYVETWAQKLLNNQYCEHLVFIDCMCNSGEYVDKDGKQVFGTPVRVAKILRDDAGQYPMKRIDLYFNDLSAEKTDHLRELIPSDKNNFHIHISTNDGNEMLKSMGQRISRVANVHYLLVYDPFEACIDWNAIMPFLNNWGEIIINHMVSDSIRAVKMAKSPEAKNKYQKTYLAHDIQELIPYGSNREAYEKRIEEIIRRLHHSHDRQYYIAAFPFFNKNNAIVYNLIHCTSNIAGFRLYKEVAWKTFGGKSSTKNTHGEENQFEFDPDNIVAVLKTHVDESCYYVKDIADYLQKCFRGQQGVPLSRLWEALDAHPLFPSDGFKKQIKTELKKIYMDKESKGTMDFTDRG
jgi:three-Cys-motif partner protein